MNMRREFDLPLVAEIIGRAILNGEILREADKELVWKSLQEVAPGYPRDAFDRHWKQRNVS